MSAQASETPANIENSFGFIDLSGAPFDELAVRIAEAHEQGMVLGAGDYVHTQQCHVDTGHVALAYQARRADHPENAEVTGHG